MREGKNTQREKILEKINNLQLDAAKSSGEKQVSRKSERRKRKAEAALDEERAAGLAADKREVEAAYAAKRKAAQEAETTQPRPATQPAQTAQWLTTKETLILAQTSRTTVHKATKAGTFPRPIKIGKKCVWIEEEIKQWMKR